jgi:hypothetical protein
MEQKAKEDAKRNIIVVGRAPIWFFPFLSSITNNGSAPNGNEIELISISDYLGSFSLSLPAARVVRLVVN